MALTVRPDVRWAMKMSREIKNLPDKPPPCECIILTTTQGYRAPIIVGVEDRGRAPACPNRAAWAVAWRRHCNCPGSFTSALICGDCKRKIVDIVSGCQSCGTPVTFTYCEPLGKEVKP